MKTPKTLRSRIIYFFCGYLAALLLVYSAAMFGMFKFAEDLAFNQQLLEVSARIVRHVQEHGNTPQYLPAHITAYTSLASVPDELKVFLRGRRPGAFEINADHLNYHTAVVKVPSTGQALYVFYDVASIESNEGFQSFMTLALALVGMTVLFAGWVLARSLSNRILNPISQLTEEVKSLSLDEEKVAPSSFGTSDEVGVLAETISQLRMRISEFTRREREFTSHASHELRTPATVIKGAVEILKSRGKESDMTKTSPLARIERAVKDIEALIDTFLTLARQGQKVDENETCDLQIIVQDVLDSNQYLLETKSLDVEVRSSDSRQVRAPSSFLKIALGNLVRNAFQYTPSGKIEILLLADRVSVIDTGPGFDAGRQKAGLGLSIVERLCQSINWRLDITGAPGKGARADLIFTSNQTES